MKKILILLAILINIFCFVFQEVKATWILDWWWNMTVDEWTIIFLDITSTDTNCEVIYNPYSTWWMQMNYTPSDMETIEFIPSYTHYDKYLTVTAPSVSESKTFELEYAADYTCDWWKTLERGWWIIEITVQPISKATGVNWVYAWEDMELFEWETINLSSSLTWACLYKSWFNWEWKQDSPKSPYTLDWIDRYTEKLSLKAPQVDKDTIFTYTAESSPNCLWTTTLTSDSVNIKVKNKSNWWWKSYSDRMRDEARKLFKDEESIWKIEITLEKEEEIWWIDLSWNNIWWTNQVQYEVQWDWKSDFKNPKSRWIKWRNISFSNDNFKNNEIAYIRVRATYGWKSSNWSNVLRYIPNQWILFDFRVSCSNECSNISYDDIFLDPDFLMDIFMDPAIDCSCKNKKVDFSNLIN